MDYFNTIRLRRKIIEKFKEYSRKTSPSYSETLEYMIAYFEDTGISPYDTIYNPILASTIAINRRTDYLIVLLKNIEKTQLIPTRLMLESLFEEQEKKQPLLIERTQKEIEELKSEEEKIADYYREQYEDTNKELFNARERLFEVKSKLVLINNTFGQNYYKLNITKEKFEVLFSDK